MTVDAARQHHYAHFDQLYDGPELWPDSPSTSRQDTFGHLDLVTQMAFHANMVPEFSTKPPFLSSQSTQQHQQWTGREAYRPQPQSSPCSSRWQSQHGQMSPRRPLAHEADTWAPRARDGTHAHAPSRQGQPCPSRSPPVVGHIRHQSSVDFGEDLLRNSHDTVDENIFADWCWGPRERPGKRPVHEGYMQWGSDSGFNSPRDSPGSGSGDEVDATSLPRANVADREGAGLTTTSFGYRSDAFGPRGALSPPPPPGERATAWPVLRTRTGSIDADVLSTYRALSLEYLGAAMHQRKPLATVGPRREKLTAQQKRRNHILHEKKRRALIKDGFDDLLGLVPDVRDRGLSKSAILLQAADWLSDLVRENKALRAQARALDGSGSGPGTTASSPRPASRAPKSHRRPNRRA